jgi:prolyl-tRNA synthetase
MVGTLIMMHGDDDGLVFAAAHCADPHRHSAGDAETRNARRGPERSARIRATAARHYLAWRAARSAPDQRDLGGGVKNWEWIKKGVPLRVELGPRDLESGQVAVSRRDGLCSRDR